MSLPRLCFVSFVCLSSSVFSGLSVAQAQDIGGFRYDNTKPIEMASDRLEVRQEAQQAVFTGNVIARQGAVQLEAERLEVEYQTEAGAAGNQGGAIRSLYATGNVFIAAETETAQADWARYEPATGIVTMGDQVTLTQEDNVLTGKALEIDITTGVAKLSGRVGVVFKPARQ